MGIKPQYRPLPRHDSLFKCHVYRLKETSNKHEMNSTVFPCSQQNPRITTMVREEEKKSFNWSLNLQYTYVFLEISTEISYLQRSVLEHEAFETSDNT